MAVTTNATLTISAGDGLSGDVNLTKVATNSFTGVFSELAQSVTVGTSSVTIPIPVSGGVAQGVYVRNTSSTQNITVTWTPQGETSVISIQLTPGSFVFFLGATAGSVGGVTALSLIASASGGSVEYFLCG